MRLRCAWTLNLNSFTSASYFTIRVSPYQCEDSDLQGMLLQRKLLRPPLRDLESVCIQCLLRISRTGPPRRPFSFSPRRNEAIATNPKLRSLWRKEYFSANGSLRNSKAAFMNTGIANVFNVQKGAALSGPPATETQPLPERLPPNSDLANQSSEPPHRRRKRLKDAAADEAPLPLDASSRLSTLSSTLPAASLRRLLTTCLSLSKPRLSFLIILTTATAYSLYPVPTLLLPTTTASPSLSALTLVFLTSGTALCCASANALNMLFEPRYDAMMSRTRNRPLVRGLISKKGALTFACVAGVLGVGGLWFGVNPTVAFLGGLNIVLYAGVYTPMKRISVLNTWIGAIVGGIPPLMGWAAAAGQSATSSGEWKELLFNEESIGGWLLAGLLFAWQFPHFNSLSWPIREEYKNAGYRMLAWTNARMNGRVALRYSVLMFPICVGLWYFQITDGGFLVTSSVVNAWMVKEAWRFWRREGYKGSARGLFWASVLHLPVVMVLAMVHKKGLWEGIWKRLNDNMDEDADETWMDEDTVHAHHGQRHPMQVVRSLNTARA